jgi:hypothetical protein
MGERRRAWFGVVLALVLGGLVVPAAGAAEVPNGDGVQVDPEQGTRDGEPLDELPAHITLVTDTGTRPDWSPDGRKLVVLEGSPLGQAAIVDVSTGKHRVVTDHFDHQGISRAYFLHNGDLILCGPTSGPMPSADQPEAGRFTGVMSVLRKPYSRKPQPLGMPCWEGIAPSRRSNRIAWNRSDIDYTDENLAQRVVNGVSEIWTGEVRYQHGRAYLADVERVVDRTAVSPIAVLEAQGFRGKRDREVMFTAYAFQGGEVFGALRRTGKVTNYSNSPVYEEVEGIAPNGRYALVERDLESTATPGPLDIWMLPLDGRGDFERLTYFNRYRGGFYASNPTVSPDGRRIAFQQSFDGPVEGAGQGILLFDLAAFERSSGGG